METLHKLYTAVVRAHHGSGTETGGDTGQAATSSSSAHLGAGLGSGGTATTTTELAQLPRHPDALHLGQPRLLGHPGDDGTTAKPHKFNKINILARAFNLSNPSDSSSTTSSSTATPLPETATALDRLLALPPELQLKTLSYLDFGDIARLRRTCRFFHARITPDLVRSLLSGGFDRAIRNTCRICLTQYQRGTQLVSTDENDALFPFSSRCFDCVWLNKDFVVGHKYLLGSDVAVFVCRWCGWPVTNQPAWNQPEFHKACFKRYTRVVFFYYLIGLAQWIAVFIASGLCWHYFRQRNLWVVGVVVAGFIASLWVFCLNALRGTIMRTYHFALIIEATILASWIVPLRSLFRIASRRQPSSMNAYEIATLVFILFNMAFRSINVIGNAILVCEYKLWLHKKAEMSPARKAWIHAIEVFIFFVEPQCVEQEYPPRWWFRRRPLTEPANEDGIIGVDGVGGNALYAQPPNIANAQPPGIATV